MIEQWSSKASTVLEQEGTTVIEQCSSKAATVIEHDQAVLEQGCCCAAVLPWSSKSATVLPCYRGREGYRGAMVEQGCYRATVVEQVCYLAAVLPRWSEAATVLPWSSKPRQ